MLATYRFSPYLASRHGSGTLQVPWVHLGSCGRRYPHMPSRRSLRLHRQPGRTLATPSTTTAA
jgi:hypothetical protein